MGRKQQHLLTITQEQLRKMRKKADRELGLQKNTVGYGAHKTFKDRPRKNTVKTKDIEDE